MADITKCSGFGCDLKNMCYRYTSTPGVWQSYFLTPPIEKGKCDMFWGDQQESIYNYLRDITGGKYHETR